jgi:hypothetical protein
MRYLLVLISLMSAPSFSCDEISGVYKSNSESHWNYEVSIDGSDLYVHYTNHWYVDDELLKMTERYEVNSDFIGYCRKKGNEYLLKFDSKVISISHEDYSESSSNNEKSQKISGTFFGDHRINLWKN